MPDWQRRLLNPIRCATAVALFALAAAPSEALTTTPSPTFTPTRPCGPTATPYCADLCVPCPTIRPNCYADACGECHENPKCAPDEICLRYGPSSCCSCATVYPGPSPTPTAPRRADTLISGRVYDAARGTGAPLAGAVVEYRYDGGSHFPDESGSLVTEKNGRFQVRLPLGPFDRVDLTAAATGFASLSSFVTARSPAVDIGLPAIGGIVQVDPSGNTVQCAGAFDVTVTNGGPPGETLVIIDIDLSHQLIEGDTGQGFTWDLSGIDFPVSLASGESVVVPITFHGSDQGLSSRLSLDVVSGARETERGVYRGTLVGCPATPTPTNTVPPPTPTSTVPMPVATRPVCARGCNADGAITIEELISAVREAVGNTPAAGCQSFDRNFDGQIGIDELVQLVLAALYGCAIEQGAPLGLDGVYDAQGTETDEFGSEPRAGLAVVEYFNGRLQIGVEFGIGEWLSFSAYPAGDRVLELEGGGVESGDLAFGAYGRATATEENGGGRIDAVLELTGSVASGPRRLVLALERSPAGTPSDFGGSHRLRLQHSPLSGPAFESTIALEINLPFSGRGRCAVTRDIREDDIVLADLPEGDCRVSPLGRFSYAPPYDDGGEYAPPIQLFGDFTAGEGSFVIGAFPAVRDHGIWHAVRAD